MRITSPHRERPVIGLLTPAFGAMLEKLELDSVAGN